MDSPSRKLRRRHGFSLITVLWVMVAASIVLLRSTLTGRDAFASARNRMLLLRASWIAEGCAEVVRASSDAILADKVNRSSLMARWVGLDVRLASTLDSMRQTVRFLDGCTFQFEAAGSRVDLNSASPEQLRRAIMEGTGTDRPDLVDAVVDWRDGDDAPSGNGAERDWYVANGRALPRNGPFADMRELTLVRGLEDTVAAAQLEPLFGIDQAVVSLNNAPLAVLMSVPGISREAATLLVAARQRGRPIVDLQAFSGMLSPSAADTLLSQFPEATRLSSLEPSAWVLRVDGISGSPPVTERLEIRLVRSGDHVALVRRKSSP